MTPDQTIEQEIIAKGKTAARVTPADIEANIMCETYFTAGQGAIANGAPWHESLPLLTFCVLVLRNGFTVTGESACASPENFDADIGKKIARANAVQKIYPLMGYQLRTVLAGTPPPLNNAFVAPGCEQFAEAAPLTFQDRVRAERAELDDRLNKLITFRSTTIFAGLPVEEQERLDAQRAAMTDYSNTLHERIAAFA